MITYLIEHIYYGKTYWWNGITWTTNGWEAIWYVRKIDAENTLKYLSDIPDNVKVEEHMFST
jgi:hypothetical protein